MRNPKQISRVAVLAILLAAAAASASSEPVVRNTRCPEFQFMVERSFMITPRVARQSVMSEQPKDRRQNVKGKSGQKIVNDKE